MLGSKIRTFGPKSGGAAAGFAAAAAPTPATRKAATATATSSRRRPTRPRRLRRGARAAVQGMKRSPLSLGIGTPPGIGGRGAGILGGSRAGCALVRPAESSCSAHPREPLGVVQPAAGGADDLFARRHPVGEERLQEAVPVDAVPTPERACACRRTCPCLARRGGLRVRSACTAR